MKILLVTAPYHWEQTHEPYMRNTVTGAHPPIGLLYIAAVLRRAGHQVRVLDGVFASQDRIMQCIAEFSPQLVGISSVANMWPSSRRLAEQIKKRFTDLILIAGGPGPSTLGSRCLDECGALDAVVVQEGEESTLELVNRLATGNRPAGIDGTIIRLADGRLEGNPPRRPIADLDALPYPAFDLVNPTRYIPKLGSYRQLPSLPIETSRGCPFECIFCYKLHGRNVRYHSIEATIEEIDFYRRQYGVRELSFNDENFTLQQDRVYRFCETYRRRGFPMKWSATARVDAVNPEILRQMKDAGCWYVYFGVESGVQKNLDTLKKNTTLDQAKNAIAWAHQVGLCTMALFMFGIPGETVDDFRQTVRFAQKINSDYAEFFPITPFPGTVLAQTAEKFGVLDNDLSKYNMHSIVFTPHSMRGEDLDALRRWAYIRYCLRPRFIALRLKSLKHPGEAAILWRGLRFITSLVSFQLRLAVKHLMQQVFRPSKPQIMPEHSNQNTPRN